MDFAAGNGAGNNGWWSEESALSPSSSAQDDYSKVFKELAPEHYILAGVATNLRSGFILLNAAEQVAYSNPSAKRLLGMNEYEALDSDIFDVRKQLVSLAADPRSAQTELDRIWLYPEQESSTDLALANAAVRWLRVQSFPVRDNPGHLLGRGVLLDDITLERTSGQTRSETLALAAHQLKTPLAIIKGSATTLLGNQARWDPATQREMLQMIDTQADRLHDILNTLLEVWRLDAGVQNLRLSRVNLGELLSQLIERWQKHTPGHHFVFEMAERGGFPGSPVNNALKDTASVENLVVLCDPIRLEQAFNALLNNAVKYSPTGSTIKILLERNEIEIRLSITNQGVGIAPEHLDRIFDRFYRIQQGEERPNGSGLGLAIARATIEAHDGKIWADSPGAGQGATFYCTLPFTLQHGFFQEAQLTRSPTSVASGPLAAPISGPLKQSLRPKVFVVENDARMVRYLRAHLEEQQYRVQTISSGIQFLRQLDLEEPDVILLATRLADMSSIEILQRLREFSRTPVIMLCDARDADDENERVRLFDLGADDLVLKPFGIKELLARIRVHARRGASSGPPVTNEAIFTTGDLVIDYAQHQVLVGGHQVQLSRTEYKLLSTLAQNVGRVLTHELLLERVWGAEYNREVDFIWVYISRLRRKIEANPREPRYILTVTDVGYKLAKL